jgi:hypothetical protein
LRISFPILALILSFSAWSQVQFHLTSVSGRTEPAVLTAYLESNQSIHIKTEAYLQFIQKLERKSSSSNHELAFLANIFDRTHKTFLQTYREFATFDELFLSRQYNCLTGTILYSAILDHFGIRHEIIETNYHIFILAHTNQGRVLIETTDARNGFVTSAEEIDARIRLYRENTLQKPDTTRAYYQYGFALYNRVEQHELIGLLYYNLAVDAFNSQDLLHAVTYLKEAVARYTSPRITEFSTLLLIAVHESKLDTSLRSSLKKTLQTIRYQALPAMASAEPSRF